MLAPAIKTQGLTLPHAVVHFSKKFVPGLIYVAISRVRHPDDLQIGIHVNPTSETISRCSECL